MISCFFSNHRNKKLTITIIVFIYFLLPTTANGAGPIVWVEDGMTRVFKNDPARVNSSTTLYTAKNEYEPFQIVVKAPASNNLTNVNVTISDLAGPNGAFISSDNIALYREHYLYVTQGSNSHNATTNRPLGPGWYPDALIPFTDPVTHQDLAGQLDAVPFNLAAGENQPIWVDIYTPADTPVGLYNATATISSSQGTSTVHVSLNVWNFSLPTKRSLHAFTNTIQSLRSRTTARELLEHRLSPRLVDRSDERFLIDNYELDMVHVYDWSHASYDNCQIDPVPPVSDILKATANHEPELYLYTSYANEIWPCTDIYPELLAWATNLRLGGSHPMLVMYPINELMGPDLDHTAADIWSVLPKHHDQSKTNIEKLINHPSTEVWSYNPLVQDGYSPKFTIDFLPINARIMQGFINQSLGLTGTKFWRVDNWTNDPWNNAEASRADAPGEGAMVYPGDNVGLPSQIVSGVRMKRFREGSEDYEYIQILKDLGQKQFALNTTRTVAVDFHTWTQDKDVLYAARKLLGDRIHGLNPDPPVANDDVASTPEDTAVTIDVAANDSDPEGNLDPTSANTDCPSCAQPSNGSLVNNEDGTFEYTPNPDFNGPDSFVYEICDTLGTCVTTTASITVTPVADPPVANDDVASTAEDTAVTIDVLANDTDVEDGTPGLLSVGSAGSGATAIIGNQVEYTPNAGFFGSVSLTYTVQNAAGATDTATVTVNATGGVSRTYTEDTSAFGNPERGFYIQGRTQEQPPTGPDLWPGIDKWSVKHKRDTESLRVVRQYYHLDLYKSQDIPQSYLDIMEDDLSVIREQGMKIIPRFTYSWDRASIPSGELNDTTKEWTLRHIETVMPILAQNADVIAFVEMGFVGLWGEFWGSDNGWTTDRWDYGTCSSVQNYVDVFPSRQSDREEIINRVLDILPDELKLTLRYPRDKRAMFRDNATGTDSLPLTAAEAHTTMRKARIGFHNDSVFAGNEDEQNTFFSCGVDNATFVQSQIDWQHQDALFVPQGGETGCPYDAVYGNCESAKLRLAERRFDVLNRGYCGDTLQAWKDGGCYDEIAAQLGYRIRLISATLAQTTINPGGTFQLQIELVNDGYGKIYNKRDFEVVLKHKSTGAEFFLPATGHDPRLWLPGDTQNIEITSVIPTTGMPDGDYDVFLFLPDPDPALRNATAINEFGDPIIPYWSTYAVRLANQGVWDENTGYNDLLIDLTMGPPANHAPVVDAGVDQTITLPDTPLLDGMVTDDGMPDPPGVVSSTWSRVSGSGVVTFTDPYTVDTTADFSEADTYVLRLTADDGELTASDEVTVVVIEKVIYLPLIFKDFLPK
jgi:hypothetical protein